MVERSRDVGPAMPAIQDNGGDLVQTVFALVLLTVKSVVKFQVTKREIVENEGFCSCAYHAMMYNLIWLHASL